MGGSDPVMVARFRLHHFDVLQSTQIEAAQDVYHDGDIIIANMQMGSYGRRGRAWQAPIGNLYYTMVEDFIGYSQLEYVPYIIGLALYDTMAVFLSRTDILRLKWPNDVLIEGKKSVGILIEVKDNLLLIGVGVNLALVPQIDQPVTCLNDYTEAPVSPELFLQKFLHDYERWRIRGEQGGFASIRDDWMARAAYIGDDITARLANGTVLKGRFMDIDAKGALVLQDKTAHHVITSADIFLNETE